MIAGYLVRNGYVAVSTPVAYVDAQTAVINVPLWEGVGEPLIFEHSRFR